MKVALGHFKFFLLYESNGLVFYHYFKHLCKNIKIKLKIDSIIRPRT